MGSNNHLLDNERKTQSMNTRHDDDYNFVFKIILLGDTNVGKTHLLSRYIKGQLPKQKGPTIGVEFATKPVPLKTGGTVRVQIWDTGKSTDSMDYLCCSFLKFGCSYNTLSKEIYCSN